MIKIYSKIPVTIFAKENNLLKQTSDKTILILHQLSMLTTYSGNALLSINYIIDAIKYKQKYELQQEIIQTLLLLQKENLIKINTKINNPNYIVDIDTSNLFNLGQFIILENDEYITIQDNSVSKKELFNLLKILLYLKYKSYKRPYNESILETGGKANICYPSYNEIEDNTNISKNNINKLINKLQDLNLIKYDNLGNRKMGKEITQCNNIYVVTSLCNKDEIDIELKEGLKQQKHYYEQQGYKIVKNKTDNNIRKINGRIGYLTAKLNNKTITKEEKKELIKLKEEKLK